MESLLFLPLAAQTYSFDGRDKSAIQVAQTDNYTQERGYGYDFQQLVGEAKAHQNDTFRLSDDLFYFSVSVPDGNYKVTITVGSKKRRAHTTVRAESRRLFVQDAEKKKGKKKH